MGYKFSQNIFRMIKKNFKISFCGPLLHDGNCRPTVFDHL